MPALGNWQSYQLPRFTRSWRRSLAVAISAALTTNSVTAQINVETLDGTNGFALVSVAEDYLGEAVSVIGDLNGDGLDDVAISAWGGRRSKSTGKTYVVFGSSKGFPSTINVTQLNGSDGFVINGIDPGDVFNTSVSGAGDVNRDGVEDLVIGANTADPGGLENAGEAYVIFGSRQGYPASLDLETLDGSDGFVISGMAPFDFLGNSVGGAGDINRDGFDDLIIGARGAGAGGVAYVIFGSAQGLGPAFSVSQLNGDNGFSLPGAFLTSTGAAGTSAGDINGDGIDDLALGAVGDLTPNGGGEAYVLFGRRSGFGVSVDPAGLSGSDGFRVNNFSYADYAGWSSGAGDFNGDGIDDLLVGAPGADPGGRSAAGKAYLVFGSRDGFDGAIDVQTLSPPKGFALNGANDYDFSGRAVSSAGDFNGDGFEDLLIGGSLSISRPRVVYVVFGSDRKFSAELNLADLDGISGLIIRGQESGDSFGSDVSGQGDINGDGLDDIILGTRFAEPEGINSGAAYVLFGQPIPTAVIHRDGFE